MRGEPLFTFRYLYTPQLAVRCELIARSHLGRWMRLAMLGALAASLAAALWLFFAGKIALGVALIVLCAILAYRVFFRGGRSARARYRQRARELDGDIGLLAEFFEDGFTFASGEKRTTVAYRDVACAREDADHIVFIAGGQGIPIYKNGLIEGEPGQFREFLQQKNVPLRAAGRLVF